MAEPEAGSGIALQDLVATVCKEYDNRPNLLMEILHGVQDALGCIPDEAVPEIAQALNITRADVHGVISFYHDFRRRPAGRHVIKLCRAESCQANGSNALAAHAEKALGVAFGETTSDGAFTLEAVYCLGNCALGPSVLVGEDLHARVDAARFDGVVAELKGTEA